MSEAQTLQNGRVFRAGPLSGSSRCPCILTIVAQDLESIVQQVYSKIQIPLNTHFEGSFKPLLFFLIGKSF